MTRNTLLNYYMKNLLLITMVLYFFYYASQFINGLFSVYIGEITNILDFFQENIIVILITALLIMFVWSSVKQGIRKLRFLFSEETTEKDIFEQSVEAWKLQQYDLVYENLNYLYDMGQKEEIHNVYTISAKAILLFQKTDFSNRNLSKEEVQHVISELLNTYQHRVLQINTIHLAFAFLHLARIENRIEKKATNHLICFYLFNKADVVENKSRSDIELRIFNSYFDMYKDTIFTYIPENIFEILYNPDVSNEEVFKSKVIPFLKKAV